MPVRVKSLRELKRLVKSLPEGMRVPMRRPRRVVGVSEPQRRLWEAVKARYPDAQHDRRGLIPGRRYSVDILLEAHKLVIEVDGWEYHGKYKSGFTRDREKDRVFMLAGYRICRFTAGEVLKDIESVMAVLEKIVGPTEENGNA